jgi:transposase
MLKVAIRMKNLDELGVAVGSVRKAAAGARLLYLPPYSPNLNPI